MSEAEEKRARESAKEFDQRTGMLKGGASMLHPGKTLDPLADWQKEVAYRFAES